MKTVRFWVKKKHDDYDVIEIQTTNPGKFVIEVMKDGGLFDNNDTQFIPWHSISFVEWE